MSKTFRSAGDSPLNPFNVDDDVISSNIITIHEDAHAHRRDVNSLFNFVSKIVRSGSTNFSHSLDLKQVTLDLVEDKVPQSVFRPTYSQLRDIISQMTCRSFNESNAHESVVGVLKKLKDYKWDAKAVIALSAFALDFGDQTWRLSRMQARKKKENASLELHVFRLAEEEEKKPAQLDSTLIKKTLELIDGIITLEKKFFANKSCKALSEAPLHVYTYWAIFSLFACANNQVEPGMKNTLVGKLDRALEQIGYLHEFIYPIYMNAPLVKLTPGRRLAHQSWRDSTWRKSTFQIPSGILELLKALICPRDVDRFEIIASNTTKELVSMEELKTKNLFLFISGLDNIESEIKFLKLIDNSITKRHKKDCKILWVPTVEKDYWSEEDIEKFERLKSSMPWYVVPQHLSPIKGYKALKEEWNYKDKPIVVVADASGKVLNKNVLNLNFLACLRAFPFCHPTRIAIFCRRLKWNWFNINHPFPCFGSLFSLVRTGARYAFRDFFRDAIFAVQEQPNLILQGGATTTEGKLRLTEVDYYGVPVRSSLGRAIHATPVHIWDRAANKPASFFTCFSFTILAQDVTETADGLAFFLAPLDDQPKAGGGHLGIFTKGEKGNQQPVVAVEFDTYRNWDPDNQDPNRFHIGLDINKLQSTATVPWNFEDGKEAIVYISYDATSPDKTLKATLVYPNSRKIYPVCTAGVDLTKALPNWVRVGFSAYAGGLETHDIHSWYFASSFGDDAPTLAEPLKTLNPYLASYLTIHFGSGK
ncbi:hypothetical protein PIB30_072187 [Stylosanthes scabra]|uniref:Legume lectin domain-containing protein n=1 Tax=Stylosanthes scabra TaxID=79078 RepID=A0ABU6VNP8_9FABA|nr:hypothetical protein [Stylosanthes scabra]